MLNNYFCYVYSFGLNRSDINRYAMIFKYGRIDSKTILKVLIIFKDKYIESSEYNYCGKVGILINALLSSYLFRTICTHIYTISYNIRRNNI